MLEVTDDPLLTDTFPPSAPQNTSARLLRLGIAVTAFSSLEKYVDSRFEDLMSKVQTSPVQFSSFDDDLKSFLSREAALGLLNRTSYIEDGLKQGYFDTNIARVAKYLEVPAIYTAYGFSPRGSNIGHGDIKEALRALGLKDPWGKLVAITTAIGSKRVSLFDDYKAMAAKRHKSAHDPMSNVPTADLKTHLEMAIAIGIGIDILTTTIGDAYVAASNKGDLAARLLALSYPVRFIDQQADGSLLERATATGRGIKQYLTESAAITGASGRAKFAFLILRAPSTMPLALA